MARKSFSSGGKRPFWLIILVAIIGYVVQRLNTQDTAPRSTDRSQQPTRRATSSAPRSSSSRPPASRPPAMSESGGQLETDVVERVVDGDTVKLQRGGTIRLIGVDTPEKAQEGGQEAKAWATQMLTGKTVGVELCAKQPHDRYGRGLGFIYLTGRDGQRVLFNRELVRNGYARVYSLRPCTIDDESWNADYEDARRARRGLFASLGDVPDAASWRKARR